MTITCCAAAPPSMSVPRLQSTKMWITLPRPQGVAPDIGFDETPFSSVPDVTLIKRAVVGSVAAGNAVTYTLSYTNAGTQLATQVLITDPVPLTLSGVSYQ